MISGLNQSLWIQTIIILILIQFSEEKCEKIKKVITSLSQYHVINTKLYTYISCTDITPNYDLYSDVMGETDDSIDSVIITQSNMPELRQEMLQNISINDIKIQANVEIVQSKAFENCNISSITLDDNDIKIIKDMSFNSTLIQLLSLQNNSLTKINSDNFFGLYSLNKLNLKYNNIDDIEEDSFTSLVNLTELDLSFNKLVELHFGLFRNTTQLQTIYLNDNSLKGLGDKMFSQCKSLKYLNIENNYITIIDARHYPNSIIFINASNNQLASVDFSNLRNTDTIDISFNKLTTILDCFNNMTSLKFLSSSFNSLGPLIDPMTLNHLKNLTTIDIRGNGLQGIDFELFNHLPFLRGVSLAVNNFTSLDFSKFNNHLFSLNLSKNYLNEIKNLSVMRDLKTLDLSHNNLQEIMYETFENMTNLTQLLLQHNSIYTLHMGCFKDLKQLRQLNLGHNKITKVEIGAFTGLKLLTTLDISYNNLSHLEENVFHSTRQLASLNIAYNSLKNIEVKRILVQSTWFREINLIGNNWTCKSLAELARRNTYILLTHGTFYNVTNVFGIPCNNTDEGEINKFNSVVNVSTYLNSIQEHAKEMSYKMTVNNVVLIVLLIFLFLKFSSVKCFSCFASAKQFVYRRYRNEQEMQLI